jgi:hypothetical protein
VIVFVAAIVIINDAAQYELPPPTETAAPEPTPAPVSMTPPPLIEREPEPLWNPDTHANGYCEGYCWEGICPFFDGYPERAQPYTDRDIELLANTVWGEARGCTPDEQRLVVWTVLQRVDHPERWGDDIEAVITAHRQFVGYRPGNPICPDISALVAGVLADWAQGAEPLTHTRYAPTAPYFYFDGDGRNNWFREVWRP